MKRAHWIIVATAGISLASAVGWIRLRPVTPVDAPHFHWDATDDRDRYHLVVTDAAGNPEFRQGVTTPPAPQNGVLHVVGGAGAARPGAIVEVSNPRTQRAHAVTADAAGAFAVDVEVRRGDTLRVLSREIRFRPPQPPRAGPSVF